MSAIFGIINKDQRPLDHALLINMQNALTHRAAQGTRVWNSGPAAMGFCKQTFYQRQNVEALPLVAGDLTVTAEARIDNRDELMGKLGLDKQRWANEPDSALLLMAYRQWSEKCVDHLEGEYAVAIFHQGSGKLFLAVDHLGLCPLFYYNGTHQFIFSTEIKAIEAAMTSPRIFNEEHLIEYFYRRSDPAQTINKEVFALCGGNYLTLEKGSLKKVKYWKPGPTGKYHFANDAAWFEGMKELLYQAVGKRLNDEQPVGITLSGGLDSTSIACILADLLAKKNKPLYAFSSVLAENHAGIEQDERYYIQLVNAHCANMVQTYIEAPAEGPFTPIDKAFQTDECFPNGFFYMDSAILEAAKAKKINNLFTGLGGEYWVSWNGNAVIYQLINQGNWRKAWQLAGNLIKNNQMSIAGLLKSEYLAYTNTWRQLKRWYPGKQMNWQLHTPLNKRFEAKYKPGLDFSPDKNHLEFMQNYIAEGKLGRYHGRYVNRNSYYGMAACNPMFDKDVMEFGMDAPLRLFLYKGNRRSMIREAMKGIIPETIRLRNDKMPYSPDFARKVAAHKNELFELLLENADDSLMNKFFDKEFVFKYFDRIKPFAGFSTTHSVLAIRMIQVYIACSVIRSLSDSYHFEP
jgi:asparagine synthase (glutamine-hydrolysing)